MPFHAHARNPSDHPLRAWRHARAQVLFVSHRWEDQGSPDGTGAQLRALQAHLRANPAIEFVWYATAPHTMMLRSQWAFTVLGAPALKPLLVWVRQV